MYKHQPSLNPSVLTINIPAAHVMILQDDWTSEGTDRVYKALGKGKSDNKHMDDKRLLYKVSTTVSSSRSSVLSQTSVGEGSIVNLKPCHELIFKMSNHFKSSSESKPCLQEAGGGMVVDQTASKISEDENMAPITTKKSHDFEHQRNTKIDPSPKPVSSSSSFDGDGTFIWEEEQKEEDTADDQEKNVELHEIQVNNFRLSSSDNDLIKKIKKKFISNDDKTDIYIQIINEKQIIENKNKNKCMSLCCEKFMINKNLSWIRNIELEPQASNMKDKAKKQYAIYICLMKDGTVKNSEKFYPKKEFHSEKFLLEELNKFLNENANTVQNILIYSYNSPCLNRFHSKIPCMFQLLCNARQWYEKYHIITLVAFTKCYGIYGQNSFKKIYFDTISSRNHVFNPYIKKCENIPFKLKYSEREIKPHLDELLSHEKKYKNTLKQDIKTVQNYLKKNSSGLYKDLLVSGEKTIPVSFKSPPEVQDKIHEILRKEWNKMVSNSFMIEIREHIRADLNDAVVDVIKYELEALPGNSSFFHLHQIPNNLLDQLFLS